MSDEGQREGRKFNQEHYDLLMKCSEKGDMAEWNEWYMEYKKERREAGEMDCGAWLDGVRLPGAHLKDADLIAAHLKDADLFGANLENADLSNADLKDAGLIAAHLKDAGLIAAHLEDANLYYAFLQNACLRGAHLEDANLSEANLEGADMSKAHLEGASFHAAWLNEKTDLLGCTYDSETDFTATSLTSAHIEPDTLTDLQKNIRRKYWVKWYDQHKILQYPCRLFWWLSDYGTSSTRCIGAFALLILAACVIYFFCHIRIWQSL